MLLRSLHRYIDRNRVYHSLFVQYIGITLILLHNYCNRYVDCLFCFPYILSLLTRYMRNNTNNTVIIPITKCGKLLVMNDNIILTTAQTSATINGVSLSILFCLNG